jgi:hypothetical protein
MAIGLDANCFAEAQGLRDRCAAPGSGSRSRERWDGPWNQWRGTPRPRPAVAAAARTAERPGLILAAADAVGTLGGSTPLQWHGPPRLRGEPPAGAGRPMGAAARRSGSDQAIAIKDPLASVLSSVRGARASAARVPHRREKQRPHRASHLG